MKFNIDKAMPILERTPAIVALLLKDLDNDWINNNEGQDTWSPFDVVGHYIHGEKTDWRPRVNKILEKGTSSAFDPYDRFAQYQESKGKSLSQLLDEFENLRAANMKWFKSLGLTTVKLDAEGMHPVLGKVTLRQLLATWVIHDLTHIAQVTRVMAKQYKEEMGPWIKFFRIMEF